MNSQFVNTEKEYGRDADLGLSIGTGAAAGTAAGTVVPGVGNVVGGTAGALVGAGSKLVKPVKNIIGSVFGGPDKDDKDEVHSKTVGSLPEALLNMNRLDDPSKAKQIAITAVKMGLAGKSFNEIGKYIDSSAGYAPEGPYLPGGGAKYPWGQIHRHWQQAVAASKKQASSNGSNPASIVNSAGGGWVMPVLIGTVGLGAIYATVSAAKN